MLRCMKTMSIAVVCLLSQEQGMANAHLSMGKQINKSSLKQQNKQKWLNNLETIVYINEQMLLDNHEKVVLPAVQNLVDTVLLIQEENSLCEAAEFSQCLSSAHDSQLVKTGNEMEQCAQLTSCLFNLQEDGKVDWGDLPERLNTSQENLHQSFSILKSEVMGELIEARKKQDLIQEKIQKKTDTMLINMMTQFNGAPCNTQLAGQCFMNVDASVDEVTGCINMLGCPLPKNFEQRYNNIHTGDLSEMMLTNLADDQSSSVQARQTKDGGLETKIRFDGYTITLICVFAVQIAFCVGICCYTNMQVQNAKRETVKQQAEFYQFLYQFHKQMADEEAALAAHYGKEPRAAGTTPGGKASK